MQPDKYKVVAVVVTYNRKRLLGECLRALERQRYPLESIIVVDNASTDGTDALFESGSEFGDDGVIAYNRMGTNLGGAGGFKEGMRLASRTDCDWVWIMDDDCIVNDGTLSELVGAFGVVGDGVSYLASSVFGPDGEPMNVPSVDLVPASNGYADWYRRLGDGVVRIRTATFVSLLINRGAILDVGLPIASFFIWGDDSEYTNRLVKFFGPAYMVGSSRVLHERANAKALDIGLESNLTRLRNFRYHTRNNLVVKKLYGGRLSVAKGVVVNAVSAVRLLFSGDGGFRVRTRRAGSLVLGTMDFLLGRYELEDYASHCVRSR